MTSSTIFSDGGPIFFWREYGNPYGFLSQWYPSTFTAPSPNEGKGELTFLTTEQYMMFHKAMLFNDTLIANQIMLEPEPRKQKALGRKVKGFEGKEWKENRERIVEEGNWWKFTQSKEERLREMLLETGNRELVEASPYDRIWGVGFGAENAETNRGNWGENLLGMALMRVRDRLREGESPKDGANETGEENS